MIQLVIDWNSEWFLDSLGGEPLTFGAWIPFVVFFYSGTFKSSEPVSRITDSIKPVSSWMLHVFLPCDISLVGTKSCIETIDLNSYMYRMWVYCRFASNKSTLSTWGSYLLVWAWQCTKTGPGTEHQLGKEWPLVEWR